VVQTSIEASFADAETKADRAAGMVMTIWHHPRVD